MTSLESPKTDLKSKWYKQSVCDKEIFYVLTLLENLFCVKFGLNRIKQFSSYDKTIRDFIIFHVKLVFELI